MLKALILQGFWHFFVFMDEIFILSGIIIVSDKDRKGGVSIMKKQTRDDLMGLGFMFLLLMTAIGIRAYIWL